MFFPTSVFASELHLRLETTDNGGLQQVEKKCFELLRHSPSKYFLLSVIGGNRSRCGQQGRQFLFVVVGLNGADEPRENVARLAAAGFNDGQQSLHELAA